MPSRLERRDLCLGELIEARDGSGGKVRGRHLFRQKPLPGSNEVRTIHRMPRLTKVDRHSCAEPNHALAVVGAAASATERAAEIRSVLARRDPYPCSVVLRLNGG